MKICCERRIQNITRDLDFAAKKLLELYPNDKEGILDKKLASLVNKKMCFVVCESFELEKYIKTEEMF